MLLRRSTHLLHFPFIALVCSGHVVCKGLWASEVMVATGRGNNVALACNLASEAGHWAGDLVDLAEEENTGEAAGEWRGRRVSLWCFNYSWK